jgi:transposase-like protein
VGTIELAIPKLRAGSYFPSLLEPRRRAERALLAVVQEAYVAGVSTRRVDDLVRALGLDGISKSEVSRICAALDGEVEAFRCRPLGDVAYPYLWLDATYVKVREAGRVVSMAALIATGVAASGERRVLGLELAAGHDEGSAWPAFVRSLVERGLRGVRLVISDDHRGLVKAVHEQLHHVPGLDPHAGEVGWAAREIKTGDSPHAASSQARNVSGLGRKALRERGI